MTALVAEKPLEYKQIFLVNKGPNLQSHRKISKSDSECTDSKTPLNSFSKSSLYSKYSESNSYVKSYSNSNFH